MAVDYNDPMYAFFRLDPSRHFDFTRIMSEQTVSTEADHTRNAPHQSTQSHATEVKSEHDLSEDNNQHKSTPHGDISKLQEAEKDPLVVDNGRNSSPLPTPDNLTNLEVKSSEVVEDDLLNKVVPLRYPRLIEEDDANQPSRNAKHRVTSAPPTQTEAEVTFWSTIRIPQAFSNHGTRHNRRAKNNQPKYEWLHINTFARMLDAKNSFIEFTREQYEEAWLKSVASCANVLVDELKYTPAELMNAFDERNEMVNTYRIKTKAEWTAETRARHEKKLHEWIQDGDRKRAIKAAKSLARFGGPIVDVEAELKAAGGIESIYQREIAPKSPKAKRRRHEGSFNSGVEAVRTMWDKEVN